jgi:Glycosyltransferase family 87
MEEIRSSPVGRKLESLGFYMVFRSDQRRPIKPLEAFLLTLGFSSVWVAYGYLVLPHARVTDFLNFYTGASFGLNWDWYHIYTQTAQLARERQLVPERHDLWPFERTPVFSILVAPMALIPFRAALLVWICTQSSVLVGCWVWAWRRFGPEAAVWGVLFFAGPVGIANAQDCPFFLALLCGAFALGECKRLFLCGLVLGFGLMKFHLFLLWPLVLLAQRRWRILAGFIVCGFGQGLFAVGVLGWRGLRGYASFVLHLDSYSSPERNIDINAILLGAHIRSRPLLIILTALIVGLVLWCSRQTTPLWMTFTLATAGSVLIAPQAFGYDGTMLLLPMWCVIFVSKFRIAKFAAATISNPIGLIALVCGPPLASFVALSLTAFVVAVCLESEKSYGNATAIA